MPRVAKRRSHSEPPADPPLLCPICLEDLSQQSVAVLRYGDKRACRHFFHADCADIFKMHGTSCPVCRASYTSVAKVPPVSADAAWCDVMGFMGAIEQHILFEAVIASTSGHRPQHVKLVLQMIWDRLGKGGNDKVTSEELRGPNGFLQRFAKGLHSKSYTKQSKQAQKAHQAKAGNNQFRCPLDPAAENAGVQSICELQDCWKGPIPLESIGFNQALRASSAPPPSVALADDAGAGTAAVVRVSRAGIVQRPPANSHPGCPPAPRAPRRAQEAKTERSSRSVTPRSAGQSQAGAIPYSARTVLSTATPRRAGQSPTRARQRCATVSQASASSPRNPSISSASPGCTRSTSTPARQAEDAVAATPAASVSSAFVALVGDVWSGSDADVREASQPVQAEVTVEEITDVVPSGADDRPLIMLRSSPGSMPNRGTLLVPRTAYVDESPTPARGRRRSNTQRPANDAPCPMRSRHGPRRPRMTDA